VGEKIILIDDTPLDIMRVCKGCELDKRGNCSVDCDGKNVINPTERYKEVLG